MWEHLTWPLVTGSVFPLHERITYSKNTDFHFQNLVKTTRFCNKILHNYYGMIKKWRILKLSKFKDPPPCMNVRMFTSPRPCSVGGIVMPCAFRVRSNFFVFSKWLWHKIWEKNGFRLFFLILVDFTDQNVGPLKIMLFLTKIYCFRGTKRLIWSF